MRTDTHVGIFDLFIFLGIFQGLLISWFFIKNSKEGKQANFYQGLLLLFLSLNIFEELLNNTGYIVKVLPITNYSEPTNFAFAPLYFLYVSSILNPNEKRKVWPHFMVSSFWLLYLTFQFIQPDELKYNSYIDTKHPDWEFLKVASKISDDPLGIRRYCNELTAVSLFVYMSITITIIFKKFKSLKQSFFKTTNEQLIVIRNTSIHFFMIVLVFMVTKIYYGMGSDIGGYLIATYISFMIFVTSYQVLNRSDFFNHPQSFLNFPLPKYQKSSLSDIDKEAILIKIKKEMEEKKYFTNNLSSLAGLAKNINVSTHHVSQVINEKMNKNFFELLAWYRVEEAKMIIKMDISSKLTVEELAEKVGYNSKSSFNNAFKKLTSKTPSEFRKTTEKI
jgi:AraC-like DNA-binding protein